MLLHPLLPTKGARGQVLCSIDPPSLPGARFADLRPQVLEVFTSLALNLESGLFVALMFRNASARGAGDIPVPLRGKARGIWVPAGVYFLSAVVYDYVTVLLRLGGGLALALTSVSLALAAGLMAGRRYRLTRAGWRLLSEEEPSSPRDGTVRREAEDLGAESVALKQDSAPLASR